MAGPTQVPRSLVLPCALGDPSGGAVRVARHIHRVLRTPASRQWVVAMRNDLSVWRPTMLHLTLKTKAFGNTVVPCACSCSTPLRGGWADGGLFAKGARAPRTGRTFSVGVGRGGEVSD